MDQSRKRYISLMHYIIADFRKTGRILVLVSFSSLKYSDVFSEIRILEHKRTYSVSVIYFMHVYVNAHKYGWWCTHIHSNTDKF